MKLDEARARFGKKPPEPEVYKRESLPHDICRCGHAYFTHARGAKCQAKSDMRQARLRTCTCAWFSQRPEQP